MKIKQTVRSSIATLLLIAGLVVGGVALLSPASVGAAECGGVQTSIISCEEDGSGDDIENTGVWGLLLLGFNILAAGVGVVALGGIVYGAILYISAGGSQDQVKKAIEVFTNVVIGIIAFAGMYALLNFLVPGGIFN